MVEWIKVETKLANPALAKAAESSGHPDLKQALTWSQDVNAAVEKIVRWVPPFPYLRESLEKLKDKADLLVVSATPTEALKREWQEHDLAQYAQVIAGQEMGTKAQHLEYAAQGRYEKNHILMIGDAPGDRQAAQANDALFYPINPGDEVTSWKRFHDEAFDKFIHGSYSGPYEEKLIAEFNSYLPERPPWQK